MSRALGDPRVAAVVHLFEHLSPQDLPHLGQVYAVDARFKDPFNDVRGVPAIAWVFAHMFDTLQGPRFVVQSAALDGDRCFLTWDFHFAFSGRPRGPQTVHGATLLQFDAEGRVSEHRDYWDAAEELYEKLPVLGAMMRWLKQRASARRP